MRTSISDTESYVKVCRDAVSDEVVFSTFKSIVAYTHVLEHVSYELGVQYLDWILEHMPGAVRYFDLFRTNDAIGSPKTYSYGEYGTFSPTTLRYIKVLAEMVGLFDNLEGMKIIEIGCGYGGQAKIIQDAFSISRHDIIDLPEVKDLAFKYASRLGFVLGSETDEEYDLLISNYAFTELNSVLQDAYLNSLFHRCKRGYITCNFTSVGYGISSLSMDALISRVGHAVTLIPEVPLTSASNVIMAWGMDE